MLSKISQTQKDKYCRFHSSEAPGVVKFLEKVERWVPGAGGGGVGELVFDGDRVSVLQDEESSGGGGW